MLCALKTAKPVCIQAPFLNALGIPQIAWGSPWMVPWTIPGSDALTVLQAGTSCFTTSPLKWKFQWYSKPATRHRTEIY